MTAFSEKQRKALAFAAKRDGSNYYRIALGAGIDAATLYRWRKNPEFADALARARSGMLQDEDKPVSIEEFVLSPDYLNLDGKIWPVILRELIEINSGAYDLVLLTGSLGSGKTYVSAISIVYALYRLLILTNPHEAYGLDPASQIIVACQNRTRRLAELNDYQLVRNLLTASPWFQRYAPWDDRLKSRVKFTSRNVELWSASGDASDLLGLNLFSVLLDEANFFARTEKSKRSIDGSTYDAAREAFEGALRRKQSRFPDSAGLFLVASSKRYKGQFLDELESEYADDVRTYVFSHNQWTARPELYENGGWFHVFIGDRQRPARILDENEETSTADRELIIRVPSRFRRRFHADVVRSLQDIAGISTEIAGAFFADKEKLARASCLHNILVSKSDAVGDATQLFIDRHSLQLPNPESPRCVHGDLSLTGDLTGIACGHVSEYNERGLPIIHIDALARIHPPKNGQIELDSVLQLIAFWKSIGIPIQSVSFDGFQSADLLQRTQRLGIRSGRLSVDQTTVADPCAAYETLRMAISEGRFLFPDDPETVGDMLGLQIDHAKQRVDHLPGKKKDTADCLAAIAYHLTHKVNTWAMIDKVAGAAYAAAVNTPTLGGTTTPIPHGGFDTAMQLIRHQRGIYRG